MRLIYGILIGFSLHCPFILAGEQPGLVGPFGNFERCEIVGAEYYTAEELKKALQNDVELLSYSRPDENLNEFLQRVEGALLAGYHIAGFAEASVYTTWDDQQNQPVISVTEGPRFLNREIRIEGVPTPIADSILKWLTEEHPPTNAVASRTAGTSTTSEVVWRDQKGLVAKLESPEWIPEQVCNFHQSRLNVLEKLIVRAFHDHGHLNPKFELKLSTDLKEKRADLLVIVRTLGDIWTIDEIEIKGLKHHNPEQIIELIRVKTGDAVTAKLLLETQWKLQQSGRFRWSQVQVEPKLIPTFPTVLSIQVLEAEYQPTLSQQFSEQQAVVLKMTDWINHFAEQEHDLVIDTFGVIEQFYPDQKSRWNIPHVQICLSPKGSILLCLEVEDRASGAAEKLFVCGTKERTVLVFDRRKLKYTFDSKEIQYPNWKLTFDGLPPSSQRNVNLNLGFGISSEPEPITLSVVPFAALYNLELFKGSVIEKSDELEFVGENFECGIERQTGRLKRLGVQAKHEDGKPGMKANVRSLSGEYTRLVEQHIDQRSTEAEDLQEFGTLLEFLVAASTIQGDSPVALQRAQVVVKLLETLFPEETTNSNHQKHQFSIPPSELRHSGASGIATLLYVGSHHLLAEETQLWNFARELIAVVALKDPAAGPQILSITQNRQNGPILNWIFSEVTAHIKIVPSKKLAAIALDQLDTQMYQSDLRQLFDPRGALGASLLKIVKNYRQLSPEEAQLLLNSLPPFHVAAMQSLREKKEVSDEQFIHLLTDILWQTTLKEKIRVRLQLLHEDAETHKLQVDVE